MVFGPFWGTQEFRSILKMILNLLFFLQGMIRERRHKNIWVVFGPFSGLIQLIQRKIRSLLIMILGLHFAIIFWRGSRWKMDFLGNPNLKDIISGLWDLPPTNHLHNCPYFFKLHEIEVINLLWPTGLLCF